MRCRVVQKPDQTLVVIHPAPNAQRVGESVLEFEARVFQETMAENGWAGFPFVDLDPTQLPSRTQRHKWRLQGGQVRIDPSVPDPPYPQQGLLNRIASATTVEQLKPILMDIIRSS